MILPKMNMFLGIDAAASGLTAERLRMDVMNQARSLHILLKQKRMVRNKKALKVVAIRVGGCPKKVTILSLIRKNHFLTFPLQKNGASMPTMQTKLFYVTSLPPLWGMKYSILIGIQHLSILML